MLAQVELGQVRFSALALRLGLVLLGPAPRAPIQLCSSPPRGRWLCNLHRGLGPLCWGWRRSPGYGAPPRCCASC
eukprot:4032516-Alexandrium_andersonii.AAC.1